MAQQYRIPPGTVYPATVAGYRKAKAGKMDEVDWTVNEEELVIPAPYPEIVSSWLANGIEEVGEAEPEPIEEPGHMRKSKSVVKREEAQKEEAQGEEVDT